MLQCLMVFKLAHFQPSAVAREDELNAIGCSTPRQHMATTCSVFCTHRQHIFSHVWSPVDRGTLTSCCRPHPELLTDGDFHVEATMFSPCWGSPRQYPAAASLFPPVGGDETRLESRPRTKIWWIPNEWRLFDPNGIVLRRVKVDPSTDGHPSGRR